MANELDPKPRTLVYSRRNIERRTFRCLVYEFEDLLQEFDSVQLLAPIKVDGSIVSQSLRASVNKIAFVLARSDYFADRAAIIDPAISPTILERNYDLFFTFLLFIPEIIELNAIRNWREKSTKAVCYLGEVWSRNLDLIYRYRYLLQQFDIIFIHIKCCADTISKIVHRPCYFLPIGIDTLKFCPYPKLPARHIDVYNLGRRSPITHQALLDLAQREDFFYIYDTVRSDFVPDHQQHRSLLANFIQRSRYFINYKHSFDRAEKAAGAEELSSRLFEGAAGGSIILGMAPDSDAYREYFDWEDATIEIPYEATNIAEIIADLDRQIERLSQARRQNLINSLLRHDWVYRWQTILDKVGLEPTTAMKNRQERLHEVAAKIAAMDLNAI